MKTRVPEWMLKGLLVLAAAIGALAPAAADDGALLEEALRRATDAFELAYPRMGKAEFGVELDAYRDALSFHRFSSGHWGSGAMIVQFDMAGSGDADCARFAAYTRLPPEQGRVRLVLCPQFFSPGADDLRTLTILHEMVHVVAGRDECRAMAFAARVERLATGRHTPVQAYWQANNCAGSGFSLP